MGCDPVGPPLAGDWLVGGRGGPQGEGLPQLRTLRPPSLGLGVKFQPPHVTRHGRCLRPAPLSRGPQTAPLPGSRSPDAEQYRGAGSGQTPCPWAHRRIASTRCEVTSPPGILESPGLPQASGPLALLLIGAADGDPCQADPTGTLGFLGLPTLRRAQGGGAPSVRLSAPVSSRAAVRRLRRSAARVPGAGAVAESLLGTLALALFSSETSKTKRLSNLFGERSDAQRTSPHLLFLLLSEPFCGLGRISPGAHPHQRQPA